MSDADPAVTQPCSSLKISEAILKTGRLDAMIAWYTTMRGVPPFSSIAPTSMPSHSTWLAASIRAELRRCE